MLAAIPPQGRLCKPLSRISSSLSLNFSGKSCAMSKQEPIVIKNSAPHQVSFSEATGKATRKSNFLNDDSENATQERVSIPPQNAPGPADPTLLNAADSSATPPAQTLAAQAGAQVRAHVAGPVTAMTQTVQTPQPVRPAATPQTSQPMHAPSVAAALSA